ncbi:Arylsulfatase [Paraglaciecola mesophila]|uniref:Arylsulfatase n=1 Tax=Paraglaciecola mesophila TaxID=197222 RepID=A0A857JH49_9ALTE|nr:sulfatase-like hydrolase/transferase [Paraglaciecola mesophila]QHJ10996.1 Arylsulfatase [Paraglaciecola mesophila]
MIKQFLTFSMLFLVAVSQANSKNAQATQKPNIIVIMADDQGQWALGSAAGGEGIVKTPNLDYIAQQGVVFSNAMTPIPVCSPARASFHTGKMPSQHGVHDFLGEDRKYDANWLAGEMLLSERLKSQGYRTALLGKWHATTDSKPPQPGFDQWLSYDALKAGWQNQYQHSGNVLFSENGTNVSYTGVQAWYLTQKAIEFMDTPSDEPFFINLNFVEPHAPFEGLPERLVNRYRDKAANIIRAGGFSDIQSRSNYTLVPMDHQEKLAQYLAAVQLLDEQVGRIVDALQSKGILDNTLVIYTADHGLLMGQYGLYGKTNATNPSNFYEHNLKIPMIVYGGGDRLRGKQTRDEFVSLIDLHATVIDFASGGEKSAEYGPGHSFSTLLEGKRLVNWKRYHIAERGNARMITDGHWKLVRYYQRSEAATPIDYWYDLSNPLAERYDVPPPRETLRELLVSELEAFFSQYETPTFSGRKIWDQPYPNAGAERDLK